MHLWADRDPSADGYSSCQINDVLIVHAYASVRHHAADGSRIVCAVDAVGRLGQAHPISAEWSAWVRCFINDGVLSCRRLG